MFAVVVFNTDTFECVPSSWIILEQNELVVYMPPKNSLARLRRTGAKMDDTFKPEKIEKYFKFGKVFNHKLQFL